MRFPNLKVNRKNVEGKKLYYRIRNKGIIIIDYGYPYGDIHIYKHLKSINSENLKDILEEHLDHEDIATGIPLEIQELIDNDELMGKIFSSTRIKK